MPEIKERPILFSAPMVRAILEGRKTVTRRAVKPQPEVRMVDMIGPMLTFKNKRGGHWLYPNAKAQIIADCPYGKPGDRLWVRETWYCDHFEVMRGPYLKPDDLDIREALEDGTLVYAADGLTPYEQEQPTWKPSIHMPRWACRILLEITDVRVERLQDISADQCRREGYPADRQAETGGSDMDAWLWFRDLWQQINGPESFGDQRVWVVEFKRVTP
ncbi:hypothetical protein K1567_10460 [Pseudomonas sp. S5F11]|uniref:hypothetical protein n=1 Tax=Pseudomonas sp. S5F11 TaxID=2866385 RepID=UPI001C7DFCB0|nr:hypothetical protein [Pseudomonas sp. S5F11]MBX4136342.1 hypothetical protein [Pseudomonas sp. S5F11]